MYAFFFFEVNVQLNLFFFLKKKEERNEKAVNDEVEIKKNLHEYLSILKNDNNKESRKLW